MKSRLSKRLSPQARKLVLLGHEDDSVRALLQVAPAANVETLRAELEERGARVSSWMDEPRLMTIEVGLGHLEEMAEPEGVAYVDVATTYRL